jgi:nitroreductase
VKQAEATTKGPNIPPLPQEFTHFRSELGHLLYGENGYNIPREDRAAAEKARMRNYEFFGAPCCAVISMNKVFAESPVDAMSVGFFVQTFMLALAERGLGSCLQISVTGYPDVLRKEFGVGEDQLILCGMAIGWPVEHNAVNELEVPRDDLAKQITFLEE